MPIHAQELSSFGFEGFYVELGKELMECRTLAEKYPASELMVKKGTRMQELQKMNDEALVKEALHLYSAWQQPAGRGYVCVCLMSGCLCVCVCLYVCVVCWCQVQWNAVGGCVVCLVLWPGSQSSVYGHIHACVASMLHVINMAVGVFCCMGAM